MPQETKSLVRAIGRWSLAALMLNTIIGYLVTAVGIAAIAACLAEVASQFRQAGGPYLYARVSLTSGPRLK
jgi:amino acid transporter